MFPTVSRAVFVTAALIGVPACLQGAVAADGPARQPTMAMGSGALLRDVSAILDHAYRHGVHLSTGAALPASLDPEGSGEELQDLFIRYAKAVGFGQISPAIAGMNWDIPRPQFDPKAAQAAFDGGRLTTALAALPPPYPGYAALVRALADYRAIAAKGGWPRVPGGRALSQGSSDPRIPILRRRLAGESGSPAIDGSNPQFDDSLSKAVIRFQRRHGLAPDGIVGSKTLSALNVPVERRIAQIIANMERWRWLPRALPSRRLEVNIAAAGLRVLDGDRLPLSMRVVVGSPHHPTPVLQSTIGKVLINPPWNVPNSIWRREIFPKLRTQPDYLASKHMVIIGRSEDPHGRQIDWASQRVPPPGIRIQQVPGSFNALGRIKFDVPNRFDVYLHDTPERAAFKRPERALSHGCIRLERPEKLLAYLFPDAGLRPKMAGIGDTGDRETASFPVAEPLPVYILYWTAYVGADGTLRFRDDIYGHDERVIAALSRPERAIARTFHLSGCGFQPHAT